MLIRHVGAVVLLGYLGLASVVHAQDPPPATVLDGVQLPAEIPLFPLPDVVLFPQVARPLLIFEPRYRAMIADALEGDRIIGMVLLRPGYEADYEGRPPIYPVGCAGVITEYELLPDGRYTIVLEGLLKFRVASEDQRRPYRLGRVEFLPETPGVTELEAIARERERLVDFVVLSVAPGAAPPPAELPDDYVINALAQNLDLAPSERQDLLEQDGPLARARALMALLESR